jgi:hypothetical protein
VILQLFSSILALSGVIGGFAVLFKFTERFLHEHFTRSAHVLLKQLTRKRAVLSTEADAAVTPDAAHLVFNPTLPASAMEQQHAPTASSASAAVNAAQPSGPGVRRGSAIKDPDLANIIEARISTAEQHKPGLPAAVAAADASGPSPLAAHPIRVRGPPPVLDGWLPAPSSGGIPEALNRCSDPGQTPPLPLSSSGASASRGGSLASPLHSRALFVASALQVGRGAQADTADALPLPPMPGAIASHARDF